MSIDEYIISPCYTNSKNIGFERFLSSLKRMRESKYQKIMKWHLIILIFEFLIFKYGNSLENHRPRIAIIGGGIGGASASYFLTQLSNGNLDIDLYEAETIGGRLATIKFGNNEIEAGGTIIHPKNMYMQNFVRLLDLEHKSSRSEKSGIWNGHKFVYKDSSYHLISLAKLLYRYGFQLFKLKWYINNMIEDFGKIYDLQDAGKSFTNISALLSAMNKEFPKLLQISITDQLLQTGFTKKLIDELVEAAIVINYGQETNIQSFVSLVALAGVNADLWSVKGGNKAVPERLIYRNKNINIILSRVIKIRNIAEKNMEQKYEVTYINKRANRSALMTSNYDIVIIAAPLTSDQKFPIEFIQFPNNLAFPGNYQTTYATFIEADLNLKYFDLQETLDNILSCNPNRTKISSVGKVHSINELTKTNSEIWKIFSRKPLETDLIHEMFSNIIEKKEIAWKAYPNYSTNVFLNNFKLHDALYYVNAIEWAASAMEMSAIGGRNVAILAYNDFLERYNYVLHKNSSKYMTKEVFRTNEL